MKVNFKKVICLGLAMAISVSIFGCNKKEQSANDFANLPDAKYGDTYPIETDEKLTMWINSELDSRYNVFEEQPLYVEVQKRTGIDVEYKIPNGDANEQFNLLIASGQYPDIIAYDWQTCYGNPSKAIEDKLIIPLNEVIEKYAPNYKKVLDNERSDAKAKKDDEGRYFGFTGVFDIYEDNIDTMKVFQGPIIRSDLLAKFGLENPTTIDEWENVLRTFKANGIKAPLTIDGKSLSTESAAEATFIFGAFDTAYAYYINDAGKITYGPIEPGFKKALEVYNRWYEEGLLDPEFASIDSNIMARKMTDGSAGATISYVSRLSRWQMDSPFKFEGVQYPTVNKGETPEFGQFSTNTGAGTYAAITTQCDNIELAARYLDFAYTEDGINLFNYGIEGVTYDMVDGVPTFKQHYLDHFDDLTPYSDMTMTVQTLNRYNQRNRADYQQRALSVWCTNMKKHGLPGITPTTEEASEISERVTEISTYVEEMVLKFIIGKESFDNFDNFVETVKNLGVEEVIASKQAQLDRYNNR